nr:DAK2 domain-containing protein [Actinoplanes lichenis]
MVAGREAGVRGAALGRVMRRMARGALLGARGNSGVIVSQILRGMADAFAEKASVRGAELARALRKASEAAYAAVARPVEGTVLSVVAAAAEGASRIKSDDLLTVARAAAKSAAEALARTPQQLPVLARAGVVDAGGRGLVVLLEALVEALSAGSGPDKAEKPDSTPHAQADEKLCGQANEKPCAQAGEESRGQGGEESRVEAGEESRGQGDEPHTPAGESHTIGAPTPSAPADDEHAHPGDDERAHPERDRDEHATPGYEVQYLLDAEPDAVATLRIVLDGLGNSLVIVGTGDGEPPTWNVHVHVDDIGAAIEAGIRAGRPHRISVMPLSAHQREERPGRGAVVVAAGEGLARLFRAEGAVVVERNPSIAEMLTAIAATGANRVVLLPNDANTHAVATAAAREATSGPRDGGGPGEVRVSVVPTRSPVQALAALAVRDEQRRFDDDVIAMAEAAGACRYGEVTTAAREALTVAGRCRPGDLIGLVDSEVNLIGGGLEEVCRRLLDRMLGGGGELVTLVLGADAPASLEPALRAHVAEAWPFVEVQCYAGGQPRYHLLAGVE